MLNSIIDIFFFSKRKKIKAEEAKTKREKEALKYFYETALKYDRLHPNEQLKVEKTSILFGEEVFKLIAPGGEYAPDGDHWHLLFLHNEWIYFDRANCFLGKSKIIQYQHGYKILTCYYHNWGDRRILKDLMLTAIIDNSSKLTFKWHEDNPYTNNTWLDFNYWNSILIGVAVGDAHGVPYEFVNRETMYNKDLSSFSGFGTHNKPLGTYSDDTSLTLCLAEGLLKNRLSINNYQNLLLDTANYFSEWLTKGKWAVNNEVFDVGNTTRKGIINFCNTNNLISGGDDLSDNGNGSLMRILPLCIFLYSVNKEKRLMVVKGISSLTHSHEISVIACLYYITLSILIIENHETDTKLSLKEIYNRCNIEFKKDYITCFDQNNILYFNRLLEGELPNVEEKEIKSGGFVVDTLESCIWCLCNSASFSESVIKSIKLGGDSDTTGAVTGGVSALYYGFHNIPKNWITELRGKEEILLLASDLSEINFRKTNPNN